MDVVDGARELRDGMQRGFTLATHVVTSALGHNRGTFPPADAAVWLLELAGNAAVDILRRHVNAAGQPSVELRNAVDQARDWLQLISGASTAGAVSTSTASAGSSTAAANVTVGHVATSTAAVIRSLWSMTGFAGRDTPDGNRLQGWLATFEGAVTLPTSWLEAVAAASAADAHMEVRQVADRAAALLLPEGVRLELAVEEASRRMTFFLNSLYSTRMPTASGGPQVAPSLTPITPHFAEAVTYSRVSASSPPLHGTP